MKIFIYLLSIVLLTSHFNTNGLADAVLEIREDENGNPVWENGEYRNRNEVPLPPNFDARRKHRSITVPEEDENDESQNNSKKNFIRMHFSVPFGVELPLYYTDKRTSKKKGKKSSIPSDSLRYKNSQTEKLKIPGSTEYVQLHSEYIDSRSRVPRTWGMPYGALIPKAPKDITGNMRSKLESGYKITEEDLESGMMFRGLGGLKERAQNENLIEGLFQDKEDEDEENESAKDHISRRRM